MGVKDMWPILEPVKKHVPLSSLSGQTLAVDLSIWICETQQLQGVFAKPYLRNLFFRVSGLTQLGVKLVFVTDGAPPEVKWDTIRSRLHGYGGGGRGRGQGGGHSRPVTRSHFKAVINECCDMLKYMGIPFVQSSGEAEAMCAFLNKEGLVDACITNDGDAFLYGATTVYKNFTMNNKDPHVESFHLADITAQLHIDRDKFVGLALLLGCDYCPKGVPGVGKETAVKFLAALQGGSCLDRFRLWKSQSGRNCKDTIIMKKPAHCLNCSHVGSRREHERLGCAVCGGVAGCEERGRQQPCPCTWHVNAVQMEAKAVEMQVRKKAMVTDGFPYPKVIDEFLLTRDKVPHTPMLWSRPCVFPFLELSKVKLEWVWEYALEKILPLLSLYDLTHIASGSQLPVHLTPHSIYKMRVRQGVPCYEVRWEKLLHDDKTEADYYTTIEKRSLFCSAFPELCTEFDQLTEGKKKESKGRKKATKSKDGGTGTDLVTSGDATVAKGEDEDVDLSVQLQQLSLYSASTVARANSCQAHEEKSVQQQQQQKSEEKQHGRKANTQPGVQLSSELGSSVNKDTLMTCTGNHAKTNTHHVLDSFQTGNDMLPVLTDSRVVPVIKKQEQDVIVCSSEDEDVHDLGKERSPLPLSQRLLVKKTKGYSVKLREPTSKVGRQGNVIINRVMRINKDINDKKLISTVIEDRSEHVDVCRKDNLVKNDFCVKDFESAAVKSNTISEVPVKSGDGGIQSLHLDYLHNPNTHTVGFASKTNPTTCIPELCSPETPCDVASCGSILEQTSSPQTLSHILSSAGHLEQMLSSQTVPHIASSASHLEQSCSPQTPSQIASSGSHLARICSPQTSSCAGHLEQTSCDQTPSQIASSANHLEQFSSPQTLSQIASSASHLEQMSSRQTLSRIASSASHSNQTSSPQTPYQTSSGVSHLEQASSPQTPSQIASSARHLERISSSYIPDCEFSTPDCIASFNNDELQCHNNFASSPSLPAARLNLQPVAITPIASHSVSITTPVHAPPIRVNSLIAHLPRVYPQCFGNKTLNLSQCGTFDIQTSLLSNLSQLSCDDSSPVIKSRTHVEPARTMTYQCSDTVTNFSMQFSLLNDVTVATEPTKCEEQHNNDNLINLSDSICDSVPALEQVSLIDVSNDPLFETSTHDISDREYTCDKICENNVQLDSEMNRESTSTDKQNSPVLEDIDLFHKSSDSEDDGMVIQSPCKQFRKSIPKNENSCTIVLGTEQATSDEPLWAKDVKNQKQKQIDDNVMAVTTLSSNKDNVRNITVCEGVDSPQPLSLLDRLRHRASSAKEKSALGAITNSQQTETHFSTEEDEVFTGKIHVGLNSKGFTKKESTSETKRCEVLRSFENRSTIGQYEDGVKHLTGVENKQPIVQPKHTGNLVHEITAAKYQNSRNPVQKQNVNGGQTKPEKPSFTQWCQSQKMQNLDVTEDSLDDSLFI